MKGLFLFLFLLKGGESESEGGRKRGEKRSFRTSFSLPPSPTSLSSGLEPLVGGEGKFLKKIPGDFLFLFPSNQPAPSSPIFWCGRRGQKGEGGSGGKEKKKRWGTWLKERTRKRGPRRQLLERLVRDFQPLTSVAASSPTWSGQGPRQPRGPDMKRDGAQLDLVEKLFTSGTLHATIERSATERKRNWEKGRRNGGNCLLKEWNESAQKRRRKSERAERKSD